MNCPFCGNEMESCYLESSQRMFLTTKLHPFMGPNVAPKKEKIAMINKIGEGTGVPAYACPNCRKAVFSYRPD